jgi:branched-chain amino acid transport system permease protein
MIVILNALLSMTFVLVLRTGLVNLAISAFWGIGAYVTCMMMVKINASFWLCLPVSTLLAAVLALILGPIFLKGTGLTFVVMTLITGLLLVAIIGNTPWLGGYAGIVNIPQPTPIRLPFLPPIEFSSIIPFYYLLLIFFVLVILVLSVFYAAWTGRAWTAIGLNKRLAQSLGIDVFRYRLMAFVIGSAIAGLLGSFYATYQSTIVPATFGPFSSMYLQIYAFLGGINSAFAGPLIGTTIIIFFPEFIRVTREYKSIFTGVLMILIIIFLPNGILGINVRPVLSSVTRSITKSGKAIKARLPFGKGK